MTAASAVIICCSNEEGEFIMERFDSLRKAAEYALTRCGSFRFASSNEKYDKRGLLAMAKASDEENPADGGSFYIVSSEGEIGFCQDGGDIDWLFLPESGRAADLPLSFKTEPQARFCPKCGKSLSPGGRFCGKCGHRIL